MVEVDQVISEDTALTEASRCLSCCRICYNRDDGKKTGCAA
jgi:formate dehydrogenase beta subunit